MSRKQDSNREIRSMTLAVLPCPPLPIMGSRVSGDESNSTCGEAVGNSHDLIGHLMNIRAAASQPSVDARRAELQKAANDLLLRRFDEWPSDRGMPLETSYSYFCDFTRGYVAALLDGGTQAGGEQVQTPDLRMHDPRSVRRGDPVHLSSVEFAQAQDRIFGCMGPEDKSQMSYPELVTLSAERIIASGPVS